MPEFKHTAILGLVTENGDEKMGTITATPSRITTTTGAFPLVAYFVLAYALSWLILVPAGLGLLPDSAGGVLPWVVPFGSAVAAFVVTGLTGGRPAGGQLLRRRGSVGEEKEPGNEILPDLDPCSSDA
jgi:hypothetical protein